MKEANDLRKLTGELTKAFPEIAALYLFGSRRYRTGSLYLALELGEKLD
jgi:hypothetical protein